MDDPADSSPHGAAPAAAATRSRLVAITLDEASIARGSANIDHEREVAIYDLLDANWFQPHGRDDGPYKLRLGLADDRLVLAVTAEAAVDAAAPPAATDTAEPVAEGPAPEFVHMLSLTSLRRIIRDYFIVCDSYYDAIRTAPPSRIQAIDMGRRALHDEGSQLLIDRLRGKIEVDHPTARRLFTLICALHWKG